MRKRENLFSIWISLFVPILHFGTHHIVVSENRPKKETKITLLIRKLPVKDDPLHNLVAKYICYLEIL